MPPPRKIDRLRGNLSSIREQFPPQGRSVAVKWDCRAKAARTRAQKQPPGRGIGGLAPHGRVADDRWCLVPGKHRTGRPPGQRACLGTKNSPRRRPGTVRRLRHGGNGGQWEVSGAGKHYTGRPPGQRAYPAQKQPPAGAGGCLDAGYGRYLPRAIRVIWMHRVGSTARPRIMPS